ncbi:MAG: hypothetical protein RIQ81_1173 [Pseudomonadota bacterium]
MSAKSQSNPCPQWAAELLVKLRAVEIKLGNLHEPQDEDPESKENQWLVKSLDELDGGQEELANVLFERICSGLAGEGFSHEAIADMVNKALGGGGSKGTIKYCSAADVREALDC